MTSAQDIAAALAARMSALVPELLPNARRRGREMRVGSVAGEVGAFQQQARRDPLRVHDPPGLDERHHRSGQVEKSGRPSFGVEAVA